MRKRGPLITLLAVVVLGLVLLAVNLSKSPAAEDAAAPADTAAAPQAAPAAEAPPAPAAAVEAFPQAAKYTGQTEGNGAAIAVTVRDDKVSAYLCDGKAVEGWYQGSIAEGSIDAKGKGANALSGSLSAGKLTGTVSAGGKSWTYTAAPAQAPAGLYRARTQNSTVGWIKDSNGQVTGLANQGGAVVPAPPLESSSAQYIEGGDKVVGQ